MGSSEEQVAPLGAGQFDVRRGRIAGVIAQLAWRDRRDGKRVCPFLGRPWMGWIPPHRSGARSALAKRETGKEALLGRAARPRLNGRAGRQQPETEASDAPGTKFEIAASNRSTPASESFRAWALSGTINAAE
jgi:hypothetical protein